MFHIYCDESCHLENDGHDIMVLGAMTLPLEFKDSIYKDVRNIKIKHGIGSWVEVKWTKVSNNKLDFYEELINYFFDNSNLNFRAIIARGKTQLDYDAFQHTHDLWYYKMYFLLLNQMTNPNDSYRIFIDIKDTNGGHRTKKLHDVLCNNKYDFKKNVIQDIKQINSRESDALQLCDLLIGALSFLNRNLYDLEDSSPAKKRLVDLISERSSRNLKTTTPLREEKFNLFVWDPRKVM